MYPNLRAEMARRDFNVARLADACGIPATTMYDKIAGRSKITLEDAYAIRDALGVDMTLEELFSKEVA